MTNTLSPHQCIFSNKPTLSDLKSFVSGTSYVVFLNTFFVLTSCPPRRLFGRALSRPSAPNWLFDECSQEVRFGIISCCVPEETHDDSNFDWKTTQSSKGKAYVFITWANYLYIMLGSLPLWPSRDKIKQHLPDSFKGRYENVRGILDCTELKCELPKDYQKHSEMYSDYKSHDTFKGLICISPSGWITFVSQLYPGRISDKEIVEKSNFCQLIEMGDQYLADKGFEIHDLMALRGASLYIPPKRFSANDQFTQSQCFETMSIANVRIHDERAIKWIRAWHIFSQVLSLSSFGSINQIWTVCALFVNFQYPIISV